MNYFPLKAIQKFDANTSPKIIENGIYAWGLPLVRFSGDWDFDSRKRKLEFDFDLIEIFGLIKIKLGRKDVAKIGAASGLVSAETYIVGGVDGERVSNMLSMWLHAHKGKC